MFSLGGVNFECLFVQSFFSFFLFFMFFNFLIQKIKFEYCPFLNFFIVGDFNLFINILFVHVFVFIFCIFGIFEFFHF